MITVIILISILGLIQLLTAWYIMSMTTNMIILNSKMDELYKIVAKDDKKKKRVAKKNPIGFKTSATEAEMLNRKK